MFMQFEDGSIKGEGTDYVGAWHIQGSFDENSLQANWVKQYLGKHRVSYSGKITEQGIRGEWAINGYLAGPFHIWPKSLRQIEHYYIENELDITPSQLLEPVPLDDLRFVKEHLADQGLV